MSADRLVELTHNCSVDPVEVIALQGMRSGSTRVLLYAGEVTVPLSIEQVRQLLQGPPKTTDSQEISHP